MTKRVETHKWSKEVIKELMYQRIEEGKGIRPKDILGDWQGLYRAINRYYGSLEDLFRDMGLQDEVKKTRRWTQELVAEEMFNREEQGESLLLKDIEQEDNSLHNAINRYYGGYSRLYAELGLDVRGTWTRELIKEAIQKRKDEGKDLRPTKIRIDDISLYHAVGRHFGGYKNLYEEMNLDVEVRTRRFWTKEKIVEEILTRRENGLGIRPGELHDEDPAFYAVIRKHYGSPANLYKEMGLAVEIQQKRKWSEQTIKEEVSKRYEDELGIRTIDIIKEDRALYSAIRRYYGSPENLYKEMGIEQE